MNIKINEPFLFSTRKRYQTITLSVKHCMPTEYVFDKTHILNLMFSEDFKNLKPEVESITAIYISKKRIVIFTSVGFSGLHQWQSDSVSPYKWYYNP